MFRLIVCGLLVTAFAGAVRAGELDRETGPVPAGQAKADPAKAVAGSELDKESPAQSHYWRRGWYGGPYGWGGYARVGFSVGWGGYYAPWGWGYSHAFYSYPGFYAHRGWYGGVYPAYWGWGGWGYPGWW